MSCGGKRARRLAVAALLWGSGFALLYFSVDIPGVYEVPFLALLSTPLLLLYIFTRKSKGERWFSASILFVSFWAALPVFYSASARVLDMTRSGGEASPFLTSIYGALPGLFIYVLVALFFSAFLSSALLFKATEDVFESLLHIERFKSLSVLGLNGIGAPEATGIAAGAFTAALSLWAGYKSLLLLPFLFYAKIQVLLAATLTAALRLYAGVPVHIFAAVAAAAAYYLVEAKLYSRYAGRSIRSVKRPMRMFLSSIALLIILSVFLALFQEKAPIYASLYLIVLLPLLYAVPALEVGALSLPLTYIMLLSSSSFSSFTHTLGIGLGENDKALLGFLVAAAALGAQVSPYTTFFTAREELEECRTGVWEGAAASTSLLITMWYFGMNPPRPFEAAAAETYPLISLSLPLLALAGSLAHMVLATPLISEGAYVLALNPLEPLGVLLGALAPSPVFMYTLLAAAALKAVDARSRGRVSRVMRGFIYGIGLGVAGYVVAVHGL